MKNEKFALPVLLAVILGISIVLAQPNVPTVTIPSHAVKITDDIYSLGTKNIDGKTVEGFMIINYRKNFARPSGGGGKRNSCFAFLARGAKWKTTEPWLVNAANTEGLTGSFVFGNLGLDIQKWEDAPLKNILGDGGTTTAALAADTESPDGLNEVYFGNIDSPGAIAVTIVWGIFSGPPSQRELVEWDQVYDQVDFDWSAAGEANKMDFENIATHELGHAVGMGHPDDRCTEETMYRFAAAGEVKKRTLNAGDIAGIRELYK